MAFSEYKLDATKTELNSVCQIRWLVPDLTKVDALVTGEAHELLLSRVDAFLFSGETRVSEHDFACDERLPLDDKLLERMLLICVVPLGAFAEQVQKLMDLIFKRCEA